jgi:hypothetical protein
MNRSNEEHMKNQTSTTTDPAWVPCVCDEWFCLMHRLHVFECDCPPIEEWAVNPYRCQPSLGSGSFGIATCTAGMTDDGRSNTR